MQTNEPRIFVLVEDKFYRTRINNTSYFEYEGLYAKAVVKLETIGDTLKAFGTSDERLYDTAFYATKTEFTKVPDTHSLIFKEPCLFQAVADLTALPVTTKLSEVLNHVSPVLREAHTNRLSTSVLNDVLPPKFIGIQVHQFELNDNSKPDLETEIVVDGIAGRRWVPSNDTPRYSYNTDVSRFGSMTGR